MSKNRDLADLGGGFIGAGTGSVQRSVEAKLGDIVSVKDFGATGNGVTDDTAAIQAAVDSLTNGGTLTFPYGTYRVTAKIIINRSNIHLKGNNSIIDATNLSYTAGLRGEAVFKFIGQAASVATNLSSTANAGSSTITVASATGIQAGMIVRLFSTQVQYRNSTALAYYNDQNKIINVSGNTLTLETPLAYTLSTSGHTVSVTAYPVISNFSVEGFSFIGGGEVAPGAPVATTQTGLSFSNAEFIDVTNCSFKWFQGTAIHCETCRDFTVSNCYIEGHKPDLTPTGANSYYGVYAIRARKVLFTNNIGIRNRHMYDASECFDIVQTNSVAHNSFLGAFGAHEETYNLIVSNNVAYNCYSGVVIRALTSIINGNTFYGGPLTAAGITSMIMDVNDPERAEVIITNNRIQNDAISIWLNLATDYLQIANNYLQGELRISPGAYENVSIQNNTIHGSINFLNQTTKPTKGLFIQGNTFTKFGTSITPITIRGCTDIDNPTDYILIADNLMYNSSGDDASGAIIVRSGGYYGESIIIKNNTLWGDISAEIIIQSGTNLRAWPVVEFNENAVTTGNRRPRAVWTANSSTPTELANATVLRGSIIMNSSVSAGGPQSWQVTSPGTYGTVTGVTGTISAGSTTLILFGNDATKIYPGCYIAISGSGLTRVRVSSMSSSFNVATLESPATTSVTTAAISRTNPVLNAVNLA